MYYFQFSNASMICQFVYSIILTTLINHKIIVGKDSNDETLTHIMLERKLKFPSILILLLYLAVRRNYIASYIFNIKEERKPVQQFICLWLIFISLFSSLHPPLSLSLSYTIYTGNSSMHMHIITHLKQRKMCKRRDNIGQGKYNGKGKEGQKKIRRRTMVK